MMLSGTALAVTDNPRGPARPDPVLSVRNLGVVFSGARGEVAAVRDVSLDLHAGQTLAIVGESGSGKSVTSLALMGLLRSGMGRISSGSIVLQTPDGLRDLVPAPERVMRRIRGRLIAMIFQEPMTSLNPVLSVGDQIGEVLRTHLGASRADARKAAITLLDRVGIARPGERVDGYPHEFSGGMRQRVMIAMALACRPLVMIADEPTTALDVTVQLQILQLIRELQDEYGMAVLFITHNLGVVATIAERTAVMYAGELMETGTTEQILSTPSHPYTRGLLASLPPEIDAPFHRERDRLAPIHGQVADLGDLPSGCTFSPRCPYRIDSCTNGPIPLLGLSVERAARCIRADELA